MGLNEIIFFIMVFGGLSSALLADRLGRGYLYALIVAITLYIGITEGKVIEVFGLPTTLGTALYAVSFFATDLVTERYGKAAGLMAVKYGVFCAVIFQLFLQVTIISIPIEAVSDLSNAMGMVFSNSLRIVSAGLFVYAISQSIDIWLYDKIHIYTQGRYLWLRNNGSTFVSQAVDTYLFTFLAFYGVFDDWFIMASIAYLFKLCIAVCDTAFLYMAVKFINPHKN